MSKYHFWPWLKTLKSGDQIILYKENKLAKIETPFYYKMQNDLTRRIGLDLFGQIGLIIDNNPEVIWYTTATGRGIDDSIILAPADDITENKYYTNKELEYIQNNNLNINLQKAAKYFCEYHKLKRPGVLKLIENWSLDTNIINIE